MSSIPPTNHGVPAFSLSAQEGGNNADFEKLRAVIENMDNKLEKVSSRLLLDNLSDQEIERLHTYIFPENHEDGSSHTLNDLYVIKCARQLEQTQKSYEDVLGAINHLTAPEEQPSSSSSSSSTATGSADETLAADIESLRGTVVRQNEVIERQSASISTFLETIEALGAENDTLKEEVNKNTTTIDDCLRTIENLDAQLEASRAQPAAVANQNNPAEDGFEALEQAFLENQGLLHQREQDLALARQENQRLMDRIQALEFFINDNLTAAEMQNAEDY